MKNGEHLESPHRLCAIFGLPFGTIERTLREAGIHPTLFLDGVPIFDEAAQLALMAALKERGLHRPIGTVVLDAAPQDLRTNAAPVELVCHGMGADLLLTTAAPVEIEAAASGGADGRKARRISLCAYTGAAMRVAGFSDPVVVDLSGVSRIDRTRPLLLNHNDDRIVGHTDRIEVKGGQLLATGVISGAGDAAREVVEAHDRSFPWQSSVGLRVTSREHVAAGKRASVNGKAVDGPLVIARQSELCEISLVALGADDSTSASIAASAGGASDAAAPDDATAAERERIGAIVKAAARYSADNPEAVASIQAKAIETGMDPRDAELEMLRGARPQATLRIQARGGPRPGDGQVLEASLCLTAGLPEKFVGEHFDERTMNAAVSAPNRGASIHTVLRAVLRAAGRGSPDRINTDAIREAFEADRQLRASGFSTLSLPGVLGATANKSMKASFGAVATVWPLIASQSDADDFKDVTGYRLTGLGDFNEIAPGGQIKHLSLDEDDYTNQLKTYGAMIALTRQDLINDDMKALTAMPQMLGRKSAVKLEKVVMTTLLNNASVFFTTLRGNYIEGATVDTNDSRLNIEGLTRAQTTFLNMVDANGDPVLIVPKVLLVPTTLAVPASTLMTSTDISDTRANSVTVTGNPHAGKFTVGVSPYLNSSAITGNSATAFYLFGDPADVAAIDVMFLQGMRQPTIESGDVDFNVLGLQWRAYFDFGAAMADPRGAVRSKGAA